MLLHLEATGLLGGHSGTDINKEHQNANLLMARMINHLFHNTDALLVDFNGGTKDNAIPRETSATLFYSDEVAAKNAENLALALSADFSSEICPYEPAFHCKHRKRNCRCDLCRGWKSLYHGNVSCAKRCTIPQHEPGRFYSHFVKSRNCSN